MDHRRKVRVKGDGYGYYQPRQYGELLAFEDPEDTWLEVMVDHEPALAMGKQIQTCPCCMASYTSVSHECDDPEVMSRVVFY